MLIYKVKAYGATPPVYFRCDLSDIAAIKRSMDHILRQFKSVDVLVNNAGNDSRHSIEEVTPEYWDQAMAANLKHQFFMSQAVVAIYETGERGLDYQYEFDQLGHSVNRSSSVRHRKGRHRGIDSHAGP